MICHLTKEKQQEAIKIVNKVANADFTASPENILKSVYNVAFESFTKKDQQKEASAYAFGMTQFAASKLHLLVQADLGRKMFAELSGAKDQFLKENIDRFQNREELEKLLGIKTTKIESIPSTVSRQSVEEHLNKIAAAFPQAISMVKYSTESGNPVRWTFPVLKNPDGSEVRLVRVTEFLKGNFVKAEMPSATVATSRGDLADMVIRKFFSNPQSYDNFKIGILQDKEFITKFRTFSEGSFQTTSLPSPTVLRYMQEFVEDMMYAINFIQNNHQDAYITDLRELINGSNLSPEQKNSFALYSKELGIKGELDLLAVYPDGSFKVIDIKTTDGFTNEKERVGHGRQASIYDLLISSATGLKSRGENEIVYLTTGLSNVSNILGVKEKGVTKVSVSAYDKVTNKNQNTDMLEKEISLYRDKLEKMYTKPVVTKMASGTVSLKSSMMSFFTKQNKGGDPLRMIFNSNDELATHEDLLKGQNWLEERFPELKGRIEIHRTLTSEKGAVFFLDSIHFYSQVNKGADYHEGWHRFSQLYLTKTEKKDLYGSIKKQGITFTTRDGRTLNTESADFLDIEELLAEEFRKYAQDPKNYKPLEGNKKAKSIFRAILDALKSIYDWFTGHGSVSYLDMFEKLNNNTFNRSNYSADNAMFTRLNSIFIDSTAKQGQVIDNETFREFRDFLDHNITNHLTANTLLISDFLNLEGVQELNRLVRESLHGLKNSNEEDRARLLEAASITDDEVIKANFNTSEQNLAYYNNLLDYILEQNPNGDYVRIGDFLRAFYKYSQYKSLRTLFSKNQQKINKLIDEESLTEFMQAEEEGDQESANADETQDKEEVAPDLDYNNPGNLKSAIEFAREELKDFFNGFPRLASSDIGEERLEEAEGGMSETLSREEAFYKTLNILQGSPSLSLMMLKINSRANRFLFPELRYVEDRLMGNEKKGIEGLVPKLIRLSTTLSSGEATSQDIEEHGKLMTFLMHFVHVMSLRKVPFDTVIRRLNYAQDNENPYLSSPIHTRDNLESIIASILNDFTKGFQTSMKEKFNESDKKYVSTYDAMYRIFGNGVEGLTKFLMDFESTNPFIFDHIDQRFYFNAFYVYKNFRKTDPNPEELKEFFSNLGITINDKAYENSNHLAEIKSVYNRLKDILYSYHKVTHERIAYMFGNTNIQTLVKNWKEAYEYANSDLDGTMKVIAMNSLRKLEEELQPFIYRIFTSGPVTKMLFDGKDRELMKNPSYKVFAAYLPLFQQLARVEKNYHKRFSSGSMLVVDKLQFSHFLPNNMLITEMLMNEHINSFGDFSRFKEMRHLDPIANPQIRNSWLFSRLFSPEGTKNPNMRMGVSVISQVSDIYEDKVDSKTVSQLSMEEKALMDFILIKTDGSTELRRVEASNTAWRLGLYRMDGVERKFLKAVNIEVDGFQNPAFLNQIRNYIQHAAWKFQFYLDEQNRKAAAKHNNNAIDKLGIFDDIIPTTASKVKTFIREKGGDMNTLMLRLEQSDPETFNKMNQEIAEYFENLTFDDKAGYKTVFNSLLSDKSKNILRTLSNTKAISNPLYMKVNTMDSITDGAFRDVIANDFIMMMEDSLLFFGDFTYYKDPIKRRKIIANNGSVNMTDDIIAQAMSAQTSARSLKKTYQEIKNGRMTEKDYQLVKKAVMSDIKMQSSKLADDKMLKELQLLYQQFFNGAKSNLTLEEIRESKKNVVSAFSAMEVADAGAYINLETYRFMRMREMTWDWDKDEKEYVRQILLLKSYMGEELTDIEKEYINGGTNIDGSYSVFNISKHALTGPIFSETNRPFTPVFDKMGLRPMLPEFDWNRITRSLFEQMYGDDIDYMVMDSGSKGFTPVPDNVFSKDGLQVTVKNALNATYHAGGFYKFQQNTTHQNNDATFAVQLRSIFYELLLVQDKYGDVSSTLKNAYKRVVGSLGDYIRINSSRALTDMGLDIDGNIRDKAVFAKYIRERLIDLGDEDETLIDMLNVDKSGNFSTYLEALPFQKNTFDLIAGIVDDTFRKVRLNGTKFYQTFEMGTTKLKRGKVEDLTDKGTIELKWHGLKIVDGKVVSTLPVECRISFRKQFYPLLNMRHPDGEKIRTADKQETLRRLNEAISDKKWVEENGESITFLGVRIPLQDLNFTSHIIVKEFLPESMGDTIILPAEFYAQTGSDNDIDTVTASFRHLNPLGKIVKVPINDKGSRENYGDIIKRIEDLTSQVDAQKFAIANTVGQNYQTAIEEVKKQLLEEEIYPLKNRTIDDLERDLTVVEMDGYKTLAGFIDKNSVLFKLRKNGEFNEMVDQLSSIVSDMNIGVKIDSTLLKSLREAESKKFRYLQGVTNEILSSMIQFMEAPENYDFLTETDSIAKIQEVAENIQSLKRGENVKLGQQMTPLEAMGIIMNITNHQNNFHQRSILGSIIRFRSTLTLLNQVGLVLNKEYRSGSMRKMLNRIDTGISELEGVKKGRDDTFMRNIETPLLYKKDTSKGIEISIFNEDGGRITKDLSSEVSSLLDLFKNNDIFPSLNLTWTEIKPMIFLMAQGVPFERVMLFLNTPVVQDVQRELRTLGTDAYPKHALVSSVQAFSGGEVFPEAESGNGFPGWGKFRVKNEEETGKTTINKYMFNPGEASQNYLTGKDLQLSEKDMIDFIKVYGDYMRTAPKYNQNLSAFLKNNPSYYELAKDIAAYYGTLMNDGDNFYLLFIKALNRSAGKINSLSSIAYVQALKEMRMSTNWTNEGFEEKVENESMQSPFHNDAVVTNMLSNIFPQLFRNDNTFFAKEFMSMLQRTVWKTFGTPEDRRKVEMRVMSDFIYSLHQNFTIFNDNGNANRPYEFFEFDISPLLRMMLGDSKTFAQFSKSFFSKLDTMPEDAQMSALYSKSLLAAQFGVFTTKYPELFDLQLVKTILPKMEHGIDPQKDGIPDYKDILNALGQSYITFDLSSNPKDRKADEMILRNEFIKMVDFNIAHFPTLEAKLTQSPDRLDFYQDPTTIKEISKTFTMLAHYLLTQSSHLERSRGSFSYLVPPAIIKQVYTEAIENFNRFLKEGASINGKDVTEQDRNTVIKKYITEFEKMFRQMNYDLKWNEPTVIPQQKAVVQEEGEEPSFIGYDDRRKKGKDRPGLDYMKGHTGKLYSKMRSIEIEDFMARIAREEGLTLEGRNDFRLDDTTYDNDQLECKT